MGDSFLTGWVYGNAKLLPRIYEGAFHICYAKERPKLYYVEPPEWNRRSVNAPTRRTICGKISRIKYTHKTNVRAADPNFCHHCAVIWDAWKNEFGNKPMTSGLVKRFVLQHGFGSVDV